MSDQDHTMKLLELVHELDVRSRQIESSLEEVINDEDSSYPMPMNNLKIIYLVLSVQRDIVRRLLEENESIRDEIEKLIRAKRD